MAFEHANLGASVSNLLRIHERQRLLALKVEVDNIAVVCVAPNLNAAGCESG
jgi:hypothetical protein